MSRQIFAIIPASGVGSRMKSNIPKQYLKLLGKTILEHTLSIFLAHPYIEKVVVAVSKEDQYYPEIALLQDSMHCKKCQKTHGHWYTMLLAPA